MLHAQHYLTYVRREFTEYLFYTVLWVSACLVIFKLFPPEKASAFTGLLFSTFILILSLKALYRRIFFVHHTPLSEYKIPELITQTLLFSLLVSLVVFLLFIGLAGLLHWTGNTMIPASVVAYFGAFSAILIPTLLFEIAYSHVNKSKIASVLRISTWVMFISAFVFPLIFHPDLLLIVRLMLVSVLIRFVLFIILLIDCQLLDVMMTPGNKLTQIMATYFSFFRSDWLNWMFFILIFWVAWFNLRMEYRIIWTLGSFLFLVVLTAISQALALWSLIFKNFIRLDLPDQYILYARHVNVWHIMAFFSFVPFLLLILTPLVEFELPSVPADFNWLFLVVSMSFLSIGSYFLTNPMAELMILLERRRELNWFTLTSMAGFALASILFFVMNGQWGFFFATLFAGFFYWVGVNVMIQQLMSCDYHYLFPTKKLNRILFSSVMALAAGFAVNFSPFSFMNKLGWIFTAYFVTYLILIAYFGVLKSDKQSGFINWTRRIGNFH